MSEIITNETLASILKRYSCRKYKNTPLSAEQLTALKEAALAAPTGVNKQELRFSFITDQELIKKISDRCYQAFADLGNVAFIERMKERQAENLFYAAPLVVVITSLESPYRSIDAGIAVQTLALAAQSLGLGSCIIAASGSAFNPQLENNLREEIGLLAEEQFEVSIAIGYKDMEKEPHRSEQEQIREFA